MCLILLLLFQISADYDEPLRIELLQLATLLLKHLQSDLVHHRKELIKFGWNHLKREESASKQWAFVNVCHFLEAYQAPEKIILQVLVHVLYAFLSTILVHLVVLYVWKFQFIQKLAMFLCARLRV